jgi:type II secretory pathway component GspD/PulD (secretin)
VKRELVILLKPTVIRGDAEWDQDLQQVRDRYKNLGQDTATGATR